MTKRAADLKIRASIMLDPKVREIILALAENENRSFGNAVNQLLAEALTARGLIPAARKDQ